jgi:peptidoglycan/xylan/chitin deacetylase (PgdA/CDA1 family)
MKVLYYHYVRPAPADMPHFRYLHLEDFRAQLDFLGEHHGFVERADFLEVVRAGMDFPRSMSRGVVLTFDDGLRDHVDYVLPELERRGLWAMFFVPTGMYDSGELLAPHRAHHLLGAHGGVDMLAALQERITPDMLVNEHRKEFSENTYTDQDNDSATAEFKRILNYFLEPAARKAALDSLMAEHCDEAALFEALYMKPVEIRLLAEKGMMVGSHSVSHPVFSTLSPEAQEREITESFDFLEEASGGLGLHTFCYPYGHSHTYDADTVRLLGESGCRLAFTAEHRDVTADHITGAPLELPRHDCNAFAHGRASYGPRRPKEDEREDKGEDKMASQGTP